MNKVTILKQKKGIATLISFAGNVYSLNATAKLPKGAKLNNRESEEVSNDSDDSST